MATLFQHRILAIIPAGAKCAAVGAWLRANVDPTADETQWPGLNASGLKADPITHRWFCQSYQDADAFQILRQLVILANSAGAGITPLTAGFWNSQTRPQKIAWLLSVQAAILASYGARIGLADNEGTWDSPAAALAAMGLQEAVN